MGRGDARGRVTRLAAGGVDAGDEVLAEGGEDFAGVVGWEFGQGVAGFGHSYHGAFQGPIDISTVPDEGDHLVDVIVRIGPGTLQDGADAGAVVSVGGFEDGLGERSFPDV